MKYNDTLDINADSWPETASMTEWGRILGVCYLTMLRRRRAGLLPGSKQINGQLAIKKATILKAFGIEQPAKRKQMK